MPRQVLRDQVYGRIINRTKPVQKLSSVEERELANFSLWLGIQQDLSVPPSR